MHIFEVMFEIYMLCVSSDISHHVYYILYYTMLGFLALLEFEINYLSIYVGRHMAVTSFKFPPLFRKPKNVEIPKRLGVMAVEADSSNNFLLTLQDILNPDLNSMFEKMQVIK